jgi:hypothetical protein
MNHDKKNEKVPAPKVDPKRAVTPIDIDELDTVIGGDAGPNYPLRMATEE